jgi:hypothetical protein
MNSILEVAPKWNLYQLNWNNKKYLALASVSILAYNWKKILKRDFSFPFGITWFLSNLMCRNPILAKCQDETHTPKVGDLESSGTPECLELDSKGKNTLPWGVIGVIEKVLKCRCPKWPHIGHLDICSPSYGEKKGRKSN